MTDELHWYWAIFEDEHFTGSPMLTCSLTKGWFETLEEAQSQMRHYDRDKYRIHGVLRSDDD